MIRHAGGWATVRGDVDKAKAGAVFLCEMTLVVIQLIGLVTGPGFVLDSEPEVSEVDRDIDPALRPFDVMGCTFAKNREWLFVQQLRLLNQAKKCVEKYTLLTIGTGGIEYVCDDVGEAIFVRLDQSEHVEAG